MRARAVRCLIAALLLGGAPAGGRPALEPEPPVAQARVLRRLPHDPGAYTEGLFIDRGELFESTGEIGRSSVRRVDLETGRVLRAATVPPPLFGEGIAPRGRQIISLTWRDGIGFRWDRASLRQLGSFRYPGEGWGMTASETALVMSDGTDTLRFLDPESLTVRRRLRVTAGGLPLARLNELEWVDGEILANVWLTDRIARIDPASGRVIGWIDLAALHREAGTFGPDQVANGIAWDARARRLYVTGKEWPVLFEIAPPGRARRGQ